MTKFVFQVTMVVKWDFEWRT